MARNRKVTSNGMATVAVLGIVACSSFLLGSVTQHYFGRATRRAAPRSNTLHNHTELMGPDLASISVADSAAAPIPAAADSGERKVRSLEDATRAAFYRLPPAAGADANLSKTYDPIVVDGANMSRWFDWAAFPPPEHPFDPTEKGVLNVTFEVCLASLKGRSSTKTLQRRIHWLHFPKCGTSFGAVLYGYLCQYEESPFTAPSSAVNPGANCTYCGRRGKNANKPTLWDPLLRRLIPFDDERGHTGMKHCDWSVPVPHFPFTNHFGHAWDWNGKQYLDAAVALFRDPRRRAVSAWNNNKHSYGIGTFHNPIPKSDARARINALQNVFEFARYPAIQSCQTKMLLGEYCGEYVNVTTDMMKEAVRRVLNLEFVGLTDAFNASVCLWHHQFGGTPQEWMFQSVGKVRSGAFMFEQAQKAKEQKSKEFEPLPGGGDRAHPSAWKKIPIAYDPLDYQVYQMAKTLFVARLQKFGLWHPDYKAMKTICRGKRGPKPPC